MACISLLAYLQLDLALLLSHVPIMIFFTLETADRRPNLGRFFNVVSILGPLPPPLHRSRYCPEFSDDLFLGHSSLQHTNGRHIYG